MSAFRQAISHRWQELVGLLSLAIAFWPLGGWYVARLSDSSDDPLGLLALIAAMVLLWQQRGHIALSLSGMLVAVGLLLLACWPLPPLLLGAIAIACACCAFALPLRQPGLAMLLCFSLPLVASAQFFLGYPLRVCTVVVSEGLLRLCGLLVTREGTELLWQGVAVGVDPPCSGVRMLWMACFVAAVLCARSRLKLSSCLVMMCGAVVIALLANAIRAALLFPSEAGVMHLPSGGHEGVGLAVNAVALVLLLRMHESLATKRVHEGACHENSRLRHGVLAMLLVSCIVAVMRHEGQTVMPVEKMVAWPASFEGHALEQVPLSAREEAFNEAFPGQLARFRCGPAEVILRRVRTATRMLHSSADCFRAAGYEVKPMGVFEDAAGARWSRFAATHGGTSVTVRERIADSQNHARTDVSAWFWSALLTPNPHGWLAMTVIEPMR